MIERGFHWSSKAWYAKSIGKDDPEVTFGLYDTDGGTTGEMSMRWIRLGGKLSARLESFDDSWRALAAFADLIPELASVDGKNVTDEQFVGILRKLGFRDLTNYTDPDHRKVCPTCGRELPA